MKMISYRYRWILFSNPSQCTFLVLILVIAEQNNSYTHHTFDMQKANNMLGIHLEISMGNEGAPEGYCIKS
jgi:hypothetical protein